MNCRDTLLLWTENDLTALFAADSNIGQRHPPKDGFGRKLPLKCQTASHGVKYQAQFKIQQVINEQFRHVTLGTESALKTYLSPALRQPALRVLENPAKKRILLAAILIQ